MGAIELIIGLFGALFMLVVFVAISFVISRFSIKFFEKKTNQIWLLNTQAPQMSVFTRLFLKLNYLVYYLYVTTICFIISCGFFFGKGYKLNADFKSEILIGKIYSMMDDSLPFVGDVRLWLCMVFGMVFVLPYFIKALYYYKKTGFKFLRIYVAVVFVYYALCSFLLISTLFTLAYENFNPQKLEQLKEAFSVLF